MASIRAWWAGRFGRGLLVELAVLAALLTLYRLGRYLGRDQVVAAFDHAQDVLHFEQAVGIANEDACRSCRSTTSRSSASSTATTPPPTSR